MRRGDELAWAEGGLPEAAPPDGFKLRNAWLVSPLYHGDDCVGLSALYAIINGIRLATAHKHAFTAPELHSIMRAGLRFMDGRLTPSQAVARGLRVSLWPRLTDALVEATLRRCGAWVRTERLLVPRGTRESALATLELAVLRSRVPMLMCRGGHYTVVSGFTRASLLLFDSGGACWVAKRLCGTPDDNGDARHMLYPPSFLTLAA